MYPSLTFLGWFFSRGGWWWWWWQHREERASFPPGSLGPWVVGGGGVGRTARTVGLGLWVVFSVEVGGGSTARSERGLRTWLCQRSRGQEWIFMPGYPGSSPNEILSRIWVSTLQKNIDVFCRPRILRYLPKVQHPQMQINYNEIYLINYIFE